MKRNRGLINYLAAAIIFAGCSTSPGNVSDAPMTAGPSYHMQALRLMAGGGALD